MILMYSSSNLIVLVTFSQFLSGCGCASRHQKCGSSTSSRRFDPRSMTSIAFSILACIHPRTYPLSRTTSRFYGEIKALKILLYRIKHPTIPCVEIPYVCSCSNMFFFRFPFQPILLRQRQSPKSSRGLRVKISRQNWEWRKSTNLWTNVGRKATSGATAQTSSDKKRMNTMSATSIRSYMIFF